ncbi:YhjD/YihY/BrkB family envelope integrity protein [Vulgatibacter incomptus]|uniref:Inner membrane protein YihY, formerly thought to be RNase BN n=1 Tax=Vulgatibacter incomptus TaxID=1391653 RepID=A0A0K1P967_9BACT|nr:YhjD/YihY/BrkB family envelope integrity protein [Vulgatibacter incomptus]AKU89961.1 Inner membrane protein YihY, formerly thought to be RNase BN [Vulgatibacter incomptus]
MQEGARPEETTAVEVPAKRGSLTTWLGSDATRRKLRWLRGFGAERILLRAAALTYLSIVSLVPLLAVGLFGLAALGLFDLRRQVRAFVFENLAVGVREEVVEHLDQLVRNAGKGMMTGGIGVFLLTLSAILLLRNIEKAFDDLWGLGRMRPIAKQIALYLGLLVAGPIVLGLSLAATAAIKGWATYFGEGPLRHLFPLIPLALSAGGFVLLYKIAPAAKVKRRAALVGGLLAASVWELAKYGYATYVVHAIRSDAVYGPLAALPIFLLWIYVSWLIVLFGARIAFAFQHPELLRLESDPRAAARAQELCAIRTALACAEGEFNGSLERLALRIDFADGMVRDVVRDLQRAGLLVHADRAWRLSRPPASIKVGELVQAVRGTIEGRSDPLGARLAEVLRTADTASIDSLSMDLETLRASATFS